MRDRGKLDRVWALWGKSNPENVEDYHPLLCHMLDVSAVVTVIWDDVFGRLLKDKVSNALSLTHDEARAWIAFLSGLHDIGKATPPFQSKVEHLKRRLCEEGFSFHSVEKQKPHSLLSCYLARNYLSGGSILGLAMEPDTAMNLALVLGAHHGRFPTREELSTFMPENARPVAESYVNGPSPEHWRTARDAIVTSLRDAVGLGSPTLPKIKEDEAHEALVILSGLLCVSDWIGSSEDFFVYAPSASDPVLYFHESLKKARDAIERIRWTHGSVEGGGTVAKVVGFDMLRPLQQAVEKTASGFDGPGIIIVEAPMGEGKTEAAFLAQYRWYTALDQQGCYFALPTQATANQMFGRVGDYLGRAYGGMRTNLQLLHGNARMLDEFQQLIIPTSRGDGTNMIEDRDDAVRASEWFTFRKRGLLAPFGVGTIDQVLMGALPTRHFFLRLFGLSGKTLIVDEVHAYDTYMSTLLDDVLAWCSILGTSVILLSATLPARRRDELLASYTGRNDHTEKAAYPRITWAHPSGSGTEHVPSTSPGGRTGREVVIEWLPPDDEELARGLREAISNGGSAVVICNTVNRAQELYRYLSHAFASTEVELDLFHARFPFEERQEREQRCLERFGKGAHVSDRARILVATQVVEQSLDLDFDIMITELAPGDLVLQRMGRLHRHDGRKRPRLLERPRLLIIHPPIGEDGMPRFGPERYFYSDYILLRSYVTLKRYDAIRPPGDLEAIVEEVYGDEEPDYPSTAWKKKADEYLITWENRSRSEQITALMRAVAVPEPGMDLIDMIGTTLQEDNPDIHPSLLAQTRLSSRTVSLVCLFKTPRSMSIDTYGHEPVVLDDVPNMAKAAKLYSRSFTISHPGIVRHFVESIQTPTAWRKCPLLRYHTPAIFHWNESSDLFVCECGSHVMTYDERLGIVIDGKDV